MNIKIHNPHSQLEWFLENLGDMSEKGRAEESTKTWGLWQTDIKVGGTYDEISRKFKRYTNVT